MGNGRTEGREGLLKGRAVLTACTAALEVVLDPPTLLACQITHLVIVLGLGVVAVTDQ
jgi:hypothetical protein